MGHVSNAKRSYSSISSLSRTPARTADGKPECSDSEHALSHLTKRLASGKADHRLVQRNARKASLLRLKVD